MTWNFRIVCRGSWLVAVVEEPVKCGGCSNSLDRSTISTLHFSILIAMLVIRLKCKGALGASSISSSSPRKSRVHSTFQLALDLEVVPTNIASTAAHAAVFIMTSIYFSTSFAISTPNTTTHTEVETSEVHLD